MQNKDDFTAEPLPLVVLNSKTGSKFELSFSYKQSCL